MTDPAVTGFRLAPGQARLWPMLQAAGANAYSCSITLEATEDWDSAKLSAALQLVSDRHEILRTRFVAIAGMALPIQAAHDTGHPVAILEDKPDTPPTGFYAVLRGRYVTLTTSALCGDGPALIQMAREVTLAYAGHPPDDEPLQFFDLAEWRQSLLEEAAGEQAVWIGDSAPAHDAKRPPLPFLTPVANGPFVISRHALVLEPGLAASIISTATKLETDVANVLLAAWTLLLWRLGSPSPVALFEDGRDDPELATALGPMATMSPLTLQPQDGQPFSAWVEQLAAARQALCDIQHHVQPPSPDAYPLLAFECLDVPKLAGDVAVRSLQSCSDRFALRLYASIHARLTDSSDAIDLAIDFDRSGADEAAIPHLAEEFTTLLSSIAEDPRQAVDRLNIIGPAERALLLQTFQGACVPAGQAGLPVHQQVLDYWRAAPQAVAVECGGQSMDGTRLVRDVNAFAAHLARNGAGPGVLVGLLLERSFDLVVSMLAIMRTGAAYIPLDPGYPHERIAYMLDSSDAALLVTKSELLDGQPALADKARIILTDDCSGANENGTDDSGTDESEAAFPAVSADDTVYVLYTSGSTGKPKGIAVPHGALSNHMAWMLRALPLTPDDAVLQKTAISFDASVWEFFAPLLSGARLVLAGAGVERDPQALLETIRDHRISTVQMVPTLLRLLLEHGALAGCPDLRRVCCGGEALAADLANEFHAAMRGAELINLYGPTETTIQVTAEKVQAGEDQVPVGRIIDNVRIYVLDPHGNLCAVGVRGEIHIGGASLAKGYVNQPDLTAERFVPDPFTAAPSARMYCSGDIGAWRADGRLDFFGRADGQVKLRGFRIEFGEIESVAHALPGVINVAVAVTRDPDSEIDQLICCYTQNEAAPVDPQALKQHLARSLPEYMVPNWCVAVEAMPLTPSGKIDRKAVAQTKINVPGAANQQPRDPTELRLESVWENVLNVHPVGIDNNFFDLGGHSLLAVRLVAEVKREFGHDLPLASLFSAPTVALQAELLRQASVQADPVLAPIRNGSNDGCPVFFVHPTGGSVLCYRELARGLGDHPVYGLQDPGLESIAEYDSVEELAALYIKKIAPVVGDKPWCIAGWSSGGVIAYEMANQILAAGKPLGMVAMLDSQAVTGPGSSTDDLRLVRAITRLVSYQSGIEALEKDQVSLDNALDQLLDLARRTGVLPQSAGREQVDRLFNVFRRNVDVIGRYRAPAFHRRVLLFKATRPMHESVRNAAIHTQSDLPSFGWENLCNVVTHHVGADHLSIVSEPAAASVASLLLNEIREADRIHTLDNQVMFMMLGV